MSIWVYDCILYNWTCPDWLIDQRKAPKIWYLKFAFKEVHFMDFEIHDGNQALFFSL